MISAYIDNDKTAVKLFGCLLFLLILSKQKIISTSFYDDGPGVV